MHILFVTATYPPTINGVAVTVSNLKKELEKKGHKVTVLAPNNPAASKESGVIRFTSIFNPLNKDYPIPLVPGLLALNKLKQRGKPDIVHAHHPFSVGYFAKKIADYYRIPLVFTYHTNYDIYAEKYLNFLPKILAKDSVNRKVNSYCGQADLVITPARHIENRIKNEVEGINVKTIPAGVADLTKSKLSKGKLRKSLSIPFGKTILLTVSRLSAEKQTDILIKSLKYLPNKYILVVVGGGPYENTLRELANNLKLNDRVKFTGAVEHTKVGGYYQAADYFYYASESETQGLIFLEATSFGLPVVSVNSDAASEWLNSEFAVLTKSDPEEIAAGIGEITKRNYNHLSKSAKFNADKYSKGQLTDKLILSYEQLL